MIQKNKDFKCLACFIFNLVDLFCFCFVFCFCSCSFLFSILLFFLLSSWLHVFLLDGHVFVPLALSSSDVGIGGGGWLGGVMRVYQCVRVRVLPLATSALSSVLIPCHWDRGWGWGVVGGRLDGLAEGERGRTGVWTKDGDLVYCICSLFCGCVQHKRCPPLFFLSFSLHSFQVVHASLCFI